MNEIYFLPETDDILSSSAIG